MLKCSFATTCYVTRDTYGESSNTWRGDLFFLNQKEDFLLLLVTGETSLEQDGS